MSEQTPGTQATCATCGLPLERTLDGTRWAHDFFTAAATMTADEYGKRVAWLAVDEARHQPIPVEALRATGQTNGTTPQQPDTQERVIRAARSVMATIYDNGGLMGLGVTGPLVMPLRDLGFALREHDQLSFFGAVDDDRQG